MKAQINLEKISMPGADRRELSNAYALEMPTDQKKREYELQ